MKRVYFDNNATSPVDPAVLEAMLPYLTDEFGNASSIHSYGQRSRGAVERARAQVAALIGAKASEVFFTSGGTESDNLTLFGLVGAAPAPDSGKPKHVITSTIEHSAVKNTCEQLENDGVAVTWVPVGSDGIINPDDVRRAIRPETVLITIMHANNELGTVQPMEELGRIAAAADVFFHTDAVQAAAKVPIDVEKFQLDALAISGHKINAPKGVGAGYVRGGTLLKPFMFGGHHERDRRPGTENVPGIVALGKAAELARQRLEHDGLAHLAALRDRLENEIVQRVPHARINAHHDRRTPNTTNITFPFVEGEALVIALDLKGLACSTGAACSSGAVAPSRVLTAIGLPAAEARATLRISLGCNSTAEDVDFALSVIPAAVEHLRELSPLYKKQAVAS
jgi:cysteine desulfurase